MDIPLQRLQPEILQSLVEAYVLREGTDYGDAEVSLAKKVAQVIAQLKSGKAKVVFDEESESCDIVVMD